MSGYVRAQRDRFKHHLFAREKFCRGYAWDWMVAQARFSSTVVDVNGKSVILRRGQFTHSVRFMADVWNWDKAAVSRYLARLKTESMIETHTETGQLIITICNYDTYQADAAPVETATETPTETGARQQRDSSETNNKTMKDDERRKEGKRRVSPKRGMTIPEDWTPSDRNLADANSRGFSHQEIEREAGQFRDHHLARGSLFKDWDAAWRTWLGNARRYSRPVAGPAIGRGSGQGGTLASIAAWRRASGQV